MKIKIQCMYIKTTKYSHTTQQYSFLWRYPCSSAQFFVALLLGRRRRWRGKTEWRKISREINECGEYVSHRVHMWKSNLILFQNLWKLDLNIYFKYCIVKIGHLNLFQILSLISCENLDISEILLIWKPYLKFGPMHSNDQILQSFLNIFIFPGM